MCRRGRGTTVGEVRVYEIRIAGGDGALKERAARVLCPDENHAPPCPVPWSLGYAGDALVVAIYATPESAEDITGRLRALTPHAVTLAEGDEADHEDLVEQYRVEQHRVEHGPR